jgi:hypothetical protein
VAEPGLSPGEPKGLGGSIPSPLPLSRNWWYNRGMESKKDLELVAPEDIGVPMESGGEPFSSAPCILITPTGHVKFVELHVRVVGDGYFHVAHPRDEEDWRQDWGDCMFTGWKKGQGDAKDEGG